MPTVDLLKLTVTSTAISKMESIHMKMAASATCTMLYYPGIFCPSVSYISRVAIIPYWLLLRNSCLICHQLSRFLNLRPPVEPGTDYWMASILVNCPGFWHITNYWLVEYTVQCISAISCALLLLMSIADVSSCLISAMVHLLTWHGIPFSSH